MIRITYFVLVLCLLSGCGLSQTATLGNLTATIKTDRSEIRVGESVNITFTVSNEGTGAPVQTELIELKSKPVMDIEVGYAGVNFARWSDQQAIDPSLYRLELAPNQSRVITLTWMPSDIAYGKPVTIQGILNWREDRTMDAGVLLPVK